jgi:hypothetical protein
LPKLKAIQKEFEMPHSRYRSLPFWAWNDHLEPKEIKRQIRLMKDQKIGGFFMHSREGLETPYMGEEWQKCVKAAVDEAKKIDMEVWMYDEDRWPSGTAGGSLPAKYGDASRCKGITLEVCPYDCDWPVEDKSILAIYRARINEMEIYELQRLNLSKKTPLKPEEKLLIARLEVSGKSEWFNNEAPPDNLNPEAVKHFLEATHEKYKAMIGEEFGKTVLGIFTDEPSLADRHAAFSANRGWIPWTYHMDKYFEEHRGYDIFDRLPYIYFNGTYSSKTRHDYWWTISTRYCEVYSKTISQWCEKNGISFTGHFLQEDKLGLCARVNGSIMPHYIYQHVPGIDMLCEKTEEYITVKQCTSVAHQFSKPVVITETYGCTGWEFTFEGQKWIGDWQYVMGVNRRCQHLMLYSIKGCRKRDYPPSFNYNTTWWECGDMVEDYFARLSSVLTLGKVMRDVLIIHPMTTAWSMLGTNPYGNPIRRNERDVPAIDKYGYEFNDFLKYLMSMHYDVDLGDETIMSEYAVVKEQNFIIKDAKYKVVIIPAIKTMLRSTMELLCKFLDNGGKMIAVNPVPKMIEGVECKELDRLFKHSNMNLVENIEDAVCCLSSLLSRPVNISKEDGSENTSLLCSLREAENYYSLFVVNNDRNSIQKAAIKLNFTGNVEEWNPLTGEQTPREVVLDGQAICFKEVFGPAGSKLYIIKKEETCEHTQEEAPGQVKTENSPKKQGKRFTLQPLTKVKSNMENVLTLDMCSYSINGTDWSGEMDIWKMQREVRESLSMIQIYHNELEQRYKWINKVHENDGQELIIRLYFNVEDVPESEVYLVLEEAEHFTISLNDIQVCNSPEGWFLDKAFKKILLPKLRVGKNTIELSCRYFNSMEIEDCYIVGDFSVSPSLSIKAVKNTISVGDWTTQGYFNYPGAISYYYSFDYNPSAGEQVYCSIADFSATCIKLKINKDIYNIPWKVDSCVNISSSLLPGENNIEVTVYGSPRNMLGPFHLSEGKREATNDMAFRSEGKEYTPEYNVYPYGLYAPPEIIIKASEII